MGADAALKSTVPPAVLAANAAVIFTGWETCAGVEESVMVEGGRVITTGTGAAVAAR
jgi:hypothetical protein